MKKFSRLAFMKSDVGEAAFDFAVKVAPEGDNHRATFLAKFPEGDPRLANILAALDQHGCSPAPRWGEAPDRSYSLRMLHEYEPVDLQGVAHFRCIPKADSRGCSTDDDGQLLLGRKGLKKKAHFSATNRGNRCIVSDAFRDAITKAGLGGFVFRPTRAYSGEYGYGHRFVEWSKVGGQAPFWEITSDRVLPPVSPRVKLVHALDGQPVERGDESRGVFIEYDEFPGGELHYLASEFGEAGFEDAALTREYVGMTPDPDTRRLVVSAAFKQLCKEWKIRAGWYPVYLDEG